MGAVASRLTVTETGPVVPPSLVAVQLRVNVPSVEKVSSAQPVCEAAFSTVQSSATFDVYQPLAPFGAAGLSV